MWTIGPFRFTTDIPIGTVIVLIGLLWRLHAPITRIMGLYNAFVKVEKMGDGCFFDQFKEMKQKVDEMWARLAFDRMGNRHRESDRSTSHARR